MSKQFIFMILMTLFGSVGAFLLTPVYGFAVYYMYAILRPEVLWDWVLPPGGRWSFIVAIATIMATLAWKLHIWSPPFAGKQPWYGDPKYTRSHYLFLGFVAWICATYFTAFNPDFAEVHFIEYTKIFVVFVAATFVLRTVKDLWIIYYVITLTTLYVAYEVNFQYFVNGWMILQNRGLAGLDNNGAALLFAMVIPLCYFAWESGKNRFRWVFLFGIPILLHSVMLSFSRGAMITAIAGAATIFLFSRNKKILGVFYALAAVMVIASAGKELQDRFFSISKADVDDSVQSRWTTWNIAIRMMTEQPIFGFGIRNSQLFTYSYGADIEGRAIHSQYLQIGADSGIPALTLYVLLLLSTLYGLFRVWRVLRLWKDPETVQVRGMACGLMCSIICFIIGAAALSLEHFEMPYILMLLSMQLHAITRAIIAHSDPAYLQALKEQETGGESVTGRFDPRPVTV